MSQKGNPILEHKAKNEEPTVTPTPVNPPPGRQRLTPVPPVTPAAYPAGKAGSR